MTDVVYVPQIRAARQPLSIVRRICDEEVCWRAYELHALPSGVVFAVRGVQLSQCQRLCDGSQHEWPCATNECRGCFWDIVYGRPPESWYGDDMESMTHIRTGGWRYRCHRRGITQWRVVSVRPSVCLSVCRVPRPKYKYKYKYKYKWEFVERGLQIVQGR